MHAKFQCYWAPPSAYEVIVIDRKLTPMGSATGEVAGVRTPPIILGWGTEPSNNPCTYISQLEINVISLNILLVCKKLFGKLRNGIYSVSRSRRTFNKLYLDEFLKETVHLPNM